MRDREFLEYFGGMRTNRSSNDRSGGKVSGQEMAGALADVLKEQSEKAQTRKGDGPRGRRNTPPVTWVAFVLLCAFSGYLWVGSPDWLLPAPPEPVSAALEDAGLRMEVFNQALLVEEFRDREGRLPNSLFEAGDPLSEVDYRVVNGQVYRLAAESETGRVEYTSSDSLELFLGDAAWTIKGGGP